MSIDREILESINQPDALEDLFESSPEQFAEVMEKLAAEPNPAAAVLFWTARLRRSRQTGRTQTSVPRSLTLFAVLLAMAAALASRFPLYFPSVFEEKTVDDWYVRNAVFLFAPFVAAYLCVDSALSWKRKAAPFAIMAFSAVFINWFQEYHTSYPLSFLLICLHVPVIAWVSLVFLMSKRDLLSFTSSTLLLTVVLYLAGIPIVSIVYALFSLIGLKEIAEAALTHLAPYGMTAAPVIAAHIVRVNPALPKRLMGIVNISVAPLIAFVLGCFVLALPFRLTQAVYEDKSILEILNYAVLFCLGVFITASENAKQPSRLVSGVFVLMSAALTVLCGFLVSACLYWLYSFGYSPVRAAATALDLICLAHAGIAFRQSLAQFQNAGKEINIHERMLPVYGAYLLLAGFLLPMAVIVHKPVELTAFTTDTEDYSSMPAYSGLENLRETCPPIEKAAYYSTRCVFAESPDLLADAPPGSLERGRLDFSPGEVVVYLPYRFAAQKPAGSRPYRRAFLIDPAEAERLRAAAPAESYLVIPSHAYESPASRALVDLAATERGVQNLLRFMPGSQIRIGLPAYGFLWNEKGPARISERDSMSLAADWKHDANMNRIGETPGGSVVVADRQTRAALVRIVKKYNLAGASLWKIGDEIALY